MAALGLEHCMCWYGGESLLVLKTGTSYMMWPSLLTFFANLDCLSSGDNVDEDMYPPGGKRWQ